ncbi:hypothetical protein TSAR_005973 [Trichomalopsis sarcophagae]|uniref:Uncharacterized protein n=1 Tax=Trichomalopsis sarcophagae TaxID=543379 RepID=A0A232EMY5_9HYME|nr:hypothetical protein TSAR_005973 [Trichomalopsis sarcophagae]
METAHLHLSYGLTQLCQALWAGSCVNSRRFSGPIKDLVAATRPTSIITLIKAVAMSRVWDAAIIEFNVGPGGSERSLRRRDIYKHADVGSSQQLHNLVGPQRLS